jgi:hypothetical protein
MPIVALDLTEEEASRVDAIADREKRARKNQAAILLMERVCQVESEEKQP